MVIGSLLESKDYEQAFVEGLRAQSLEIMIWLLEQLDVAKSQFAQRRQHLVHELGGGARQLATSQQARRATQQVLPRRM